MTAPGSDDYANEPLPERLTVPGWRVSLIVASFAVSLPTFLNAAQTGIALGFYPAVLAALLAGLILCAGGSLTSVASVRSRLTTYKLIQRSFGNAGAGLVNVVIAIIHFCWFGVNLSFFGNAMIEATGASPDNFALFAIGGAILMITTTIYGFRALDRLALIAVPLLGCIVFAICYAAIKRHGVVLEPVSITPVAMTFGIALSALIGADMLTITTMPDLSRYTRTAKGAVVSMALSFPITAPLMMTAAALTALATGQTDIMKIVTSLGFGTPVLFILVMSTWTINALNLYSSSLSLGATFPRVRQSLFVIVGGAIGTVLAIIGIIDAFIPFLVVLGLVIPPIAAIFVIDSFTTYRHVDAAESIRTVPVIHWHAVATWIGSIAVALAAAYAGLTVTTVPALDATIFAALVYLIVLRTRRRARVS